MQIKNTMRYLTALGMAIINKSTNKRWQGCGKKGIFMYYWWMQTGAATVESSMESPQQIKNGSAF